jgi:hypothetical protein
MKHLCKTSLFIAFLASAHTTVNAQRKLVKNDITASKKSHWDMSLAYLSDNVYLGRRDSTQTPYVTPTIAYYNKSGFFISGSASWLPIAGSGRVDVVTIEGGYSYTSDKMNVEITAGRDFYSEQSFVVSSAVGGRLSGYFSYDFGCIQPSLELGADFSGSTDIGAGLGLEHSFTVVENKLEINPAVKLNAGMLNFYNNYYKNRRYGSGRGSGKNAATITGNIANASHFQIMDYECSSAVEYSLCKNIKLNFTPTLAIPENGSVVTLTNKSAGGSGGASTYRENLSNIFYWSLSLKVTL